MNTDGFDLYQDDAAFDVSECHRIAWIGAILPCAWASLVLFAHLIPASWLEKRSNPLAEFLTLDDLLPDPTPPGAPKASSERPRLALSSKKAIVLISLNAVMTAGRVSVTAFQIANGASHLKTWTGVIAATTWVRLVEVHTIV